MQLPNVPHKYGEDLVPKRAWTPPSMESKSSWCVSRSLFYTGGQNVSYVKDRSVHTLDFVGCVVSVETTQPCCNVKTVINHVRIGKPTGGQLCSNFMDTEVQISYN